MKRWWFEEDLWSAERSWVEVMWSWREHVQEQHWPWNVQNECANEPLNNLRFEWESQDFRRTWWKPWWENLVAWKPIEGCSE